MRFNECCTAILSLLVLSWVARSNAIDDKCGACRAVVNALFRRVDAELPKNALDMRHRLDKDGKRYGKIIDYKLSELRIDALLTTLCQDELKDFKWTEADQPGVEGLWSEARSKELTTEERAKQEQWKKQLVGYCHNILETHEDDITVAIRADGGPNDKQRANLCTQLGICTATIEDEL